MPRSFNKKVFALFAGTALALALRPPTTAAPVGGAAVLPDHRPEPDMKYVAITFDDGPRRSSTAALLDGLGERGVKATFFLLGMHLEGNEDLVRRMEDEGHQIGIHTFDHVQLTGLNRRDFDAQVARTRAALTDILGHNDFLLRPPYGSVDAGVLRWADCPIVLWSVDPEDWRDNNVARIVSNILANTKNGSVILMHDIFHPSVEATLEAVDLLLAQGFYFVTIDDLFALNRIPLKAGQVYRYAIS